MLISTFACGLALSSLPAQPTRIGQAYREQWVAFELGAGGVLAAVTRAHGG